MGNPYPIAIVADDGVEVVTGEATFTDAGNQPGGPWGQSSTAKYSGSGSPSGVVTPSGIGDLYVDDTTPALYQATGTGDTDWQLVGGGGMLAPVVLVSAFDTEMAASPPTGAATIDGVAAVTGQRLLLMAQDTATDNGLWIANTAGLWTRPADWQTGATIPAGTMVAAGGAGDHLGDSFWLLGGDVTVGSGSVTMRGGSFVAVYTNPVSGAAPSLEYYASALGFFTTAPVARPSITGSLSTVVDPAAQAVLTAIIAALAPAAGLGLASDGTT